MENELNPNLSTGPIEITADLSTVKTVIRELVTALKAGPKSRERSLVITKLDEARMWVEEAQMMEYPATC